jgi:hypothetical protein
VEVSSILKTSCLIACGSINQVIINNGRNIMATKVQMKNPSNGLIKDGFVGFSWTTLFFGCFPALFRSDLNGT